MYNQFMMHGQKNIKPLTLVILDRGFYTATSRQISILFTN